MKSKDHSINDIMNAISEVNIKLDRVIAEQASFRSEMEKRFADMSIVVDTKCQEIRDDLQGQIDQIREQTKDVDDKLYEIDHTRTEEGVNFKARMERVEEAAGNIGPFHPDVTVVVTGVRYSDGEDVVQKAQTLIQEGLGMDTEVINALRTPHRNDKPGIVKIEFRTKEENIKILQNKGKLQEHQTYQRVYMRSSMSHAERVNQINTQVLLREIGVNHRYRISGNRNLLNRDQDRNGHVNQQQAYRNDTPGQQDNRAGGQQGAGFGRGRWQARGGRR